MSITNEVARINYLPESRLFSWLDATYTDEIEWRVNGNPHEETAAAIVAGLESDHYDPLEIDHNGLNDDQLAPLWADLGYPLPEDADEVAYEVYGITPSDIAREALREYANLFDVEQVAERVLASLRAEYDKEQSND